MKKDVARRLVELRKHAGFRSRAAFAREMGFKGPSSVQRYEDHELFKDGYLPFKFVEKAAGVLVGRGDPPITVEQVYALAGVEITPAEPGATGHIRHISGRDPEPDEMPPNPDDFREIPTRVRVNELDVRASAGAGHVVEYENETSTWYFPRAFVWTELHAGSGDLKIIVIDGDSMISDPPGPRDLEPGDRVIVHVNDRIPTPPGYFVIHDGLGLVAKRCEHIAGSDPPRVRISSNNPLYQPYERTLDEAHILGRIVGRWQRF